MQIMIRSPSWFFYFFVEVMKLLPIFVTVKQNVNAYDIYCIGISFHVLLK